MSTSYKEVLTPTEQSIMCDFLTQLARVNAKAEKLSLDVDVDHFIKAYRNDIDLKPTDITRSKRNRLNRKAKGLCAYCSKPVVAGLNVCAEHREKRNAYAKAHKRKLAEKLSSLN